MVQADALASICMRRYIVAIPGGAYRPTAKSPLTVKTVATLIPKWAKVRTAREQQQVIPCRAGVLSAVIYHNGDVSVCEQHAPLGNLLQRSFQEIWYSEEARRLRALIAAKECYCTNEVFLWPSLTFQPRQLVRAMWGAKVWQKPAHFRWRSVQTGDVLE